MKVLVTGGVCSGKSFHAESMLVAEPKVTRWDPAEAPDLASVISMADGAVLIDSIGIWITDLLGRFDVWDAVLEDWESQVMIHVDAAVQAWTQSKSTLVAVTNEVGMGVVPTDRSGRIFRDLLGAVNQKIAAECDEVLLVVAGRALSL